MVLIFLIIFFNKDKVEKNPATSAQDKSDKSEDSPEVSGQQLLHPTGPPVQQQGPAGQGQQAQGHPVQGQGSQQQRAAAAAVGVSSSVGGDKDKARSTLHLVESLALVMLCSSKPTIRKQAVIVLKEVRNIFTALNIAKV